MPVTSLACTTTRRGSLRSSIWIGPRDGSPTHVSSEDCAGWAPLPLIPHGAPGGGEAEAETNEDSLERILGLGAGTSARGNEPLQLFVPVLHHHELYGSGRGGSLLDHQEPLAVGGDVVGPARQQGEVPSREERLCRPRHEARTIADLHRNGHDRPVRLHVEQLAPA